MNSTTTLKDQLNTIFDNLSAQDEARVLAYASHLARAPQGIPTQEFVDFFRQFSFTQEEKDAMQQIMEEIKR